MFRSEDAGRTWEGVAGFNQHPDLRKWLGDLPGGPPGGATLHSINIDPRDPNHLYAGISAGGFFESTDKGADWQPLNAGVEAYFLPDPSTPYGHDPHCVRLHPLAPDRLYRQDHCGLYRLDRPASNWIRIGKRMPKSVGDIGFPVVPHPRDADTAWVFPMDGSSVWPRVSPGGKPAAYVTRDAGKSWERQAKGFPERDAWWTVKRQAMCADTNDPLGLYVGTTSGEVWASRDEGKSWRCVARHLPEIFAVAAA